MNVAKGGKEDSVGHIDMSWDTDELARLFNENKELPHHLGHYQMVREQSGHLRQCGLVFFFFFKYLFI